MIKKHDEYENIDDSLPTTSESIYLHPIFNDDATDETKPILPLDDNSHDDEQSPYEEVAQNISNKDDLTMPCFTFRSVFTGIFLTCIISFASQFFYFRTSPLDFTSGIVILLAYMIGKLLSKILPKKIFNLTLNPGRFTVKEHALSSIMASCAVYTTYGTEAITVQRLYYNYYTGHFKAILFLLIMHLLAFSLAGILKRYLVWPASMIWPSALMSCGLMRTLAAEDEIENDESGWKMKRSKFFWLAVFFQFCWYWFPGFIFPLLSAFSIICMMAPHNIILSQITGANGLGLGALQFDWNAIAGYLGSPILVPFWVHVNMFSAFVVSIWIITPILYYSNVWQSKRMPIVSNLVFDRNGHFYNTTKILNQNLRVNETAYEIYGGIYLTTGHAISFGFGFAAVSALVIHTILYDGKAIMDHFRTSLTEKAHDIHAKLMSQYPEVPEWLYYILLFISFVLGLVYCYTTGLKTPTVMILSIIINVVFTLPLGIVAAITSILFWLNAPNDSLASLILPENPIGYTVFRTFTFACQIQILILLLNYKIAHYMKIPPRIAIPMMALCIIIATIIYYVTAIYLLNNVPDICTPKNPQWRCLLIQRAYTLSVLWGTIGVVKVFGAKSQYFPLLFGLVIGFVLPIIIWYLWKKYSKIKWLELIHFPIFFMTLCVFPPAPGAEFVSWFLVGFIFNFIIYRYAHLWWEKYAYILSAAMYCGVVICGIVIFFAFQLNNIEFPQWWGTGGPTGDGCPLDAANYSGISPTNSDL